MSQWNDPSNHGFKPNQTSRLSNWVNQRSDQQPDDPANSLWIARFNPFFVPSHQNDVVLRILATKRRRFNNYKSFLFLSPSQLLQTLPVVPSYSPAYHCQLSCSQSPLVLVSLNPLAIAAEDTVPPPTTAANPTYRPSPQPKLPLPAPQPRLPLPASQPVAASAGSGGLAISHWRGPFGGCDRNFLVFTFKFLFFYFNI